MKAISFFCTMAILLSACHKQIGGPRKIQAIGHIEYSQNTNTITKELYDLKSDNRAFKMKLNKNYSISGDVSGTWSPSGAQILLYINGSFGPASPLIMDYGYYETKPTTVIQGHEVTLNDMVKGTYFIAVTKGTLGNIYYEKHFVFK